MVLSFPQLYTASKDLLAVAAVVGKLANYY